MTNGLHISCIGAIYCTAVSNVMPPGCKLLRQSSCFPWVWKAVGKCESFTSNFGPRAKWC